MPATPPPPTGPDRGSASSTAFVSGPFDEEAWLRQMLWRRRHGEELTPAEMDAGLLEALATIRGLRHWMRGHFLRVAPAPGHDVGDGVMEVSCVECGARRLDGTVQHGPQCRVPHLLGEGAPA